MSGDFLLRADRRDKEDAHLSNFSETLGQIANATRSLTSTHLRYRNRHDEGILRLPRSRNDNFVRHWRSNRALKKTRSFREDAQRKCFSIAHGKAVVAPD